MRMAGGMHAGTGELHRHRAPRRYEEQEARGQPDLARRQGQGERAGADLDEGGDEGVVGDQHPPAIPFEDLLQADEGVPARQDLSLQAQAVALQGELDRHHGPAGVGRTASACKDERPPETAGRGLQRRLAFEDLLQPRCGAVGGAPAFDVGHVECLRSLHGEHVAGTGEILGAAPAEFLDEQILRGRQPRRKLKFAEPVPPSR